MKYATYGSTVCDDWEYPPSVHPSYSSESILQCNLASFLRAREVTSRRKLGRRRDAKIYDSITFDQSDAKEEEEWIPRSVLDNCKASSPTFTNFTKEGIEQSSVHPSHHYFPEHTSETLHTGLLTLPHHTIRALPPTLHEQGFPLENLDKIFTSLWLSPTTLLFGTKCNKLFILNTLTSKKIEIPSISYHPSSISSLSSFSPSSTSPTSHLDTSTPPSSGIHSISINPSKTMVAVGAGKPTEYIQIYSLPSFTPHAILVGHTDMVFSVSWYDDETLLSGSRDMSVKMWRVPSPISDESQYWGGKTIRALDGTEIMVVEEYVERREHTAKVRDLTTHQSRNETVTLGLDGYLKIWSLTPTTLILSNSIPLYHTSETVCLALDAPNTLYAVGSQAHISLIDPRSSRVVKAIESLDEGWGVRSLSINHGVITIGGGFSRVSFYDLRASNYIFWKSISPASSPNPPDSPLTALPISPTTSFPHSPSPTSPNQPRPATPLRTLPPSYT
ncbi:DDB1- and CUL4-associated factor 12, partial [Rhizophlyctis rosea]